MSAPNTEQNASLQPMSSQARLWRRLSWAETREKDEGQSCYAVGLYMFAFLTTSLCSGLCFGWPSLRRQLLTEEGSTLDENTLGIIFTVGSWTTQSCRFFYGIANDRWLGTRLTTCISVLLVAMGTMGLAFADANNGLSLAISLFFVGLGSGTQLTLQPVAGLFRSNVQGTLLTAFSGAFQISGLVFVALTAITSNRKVSFASFSALLLVLGVLAAFLLPKHQFEQKEKTIESAEDNVEEREGALEDALPSIGDKEVQKESSGSEISVSGADAESSPLEVTKTTVDEEKPGVVDLLKSGEYIWLVLWFSVLLIPLQYYVGTIGYQLEQRGDDDGTYTRIFSIMYASAAAVSPILGKFTDTAGLGAAQGVATILCAISFFMLASYDISLNAHTAGMALYGLGRMMVFGAFFTNIGKRFGYTYFGTLSGLGLLISGLASLIQYPLISISTDGRDSEVNIACAIVVLCLLPYCAWLGWVERKETKLSQTL
jgi:LAT3 family solute carrier family 43 protein 3